MDSEEELQLYDDFMAEVRDEVAKIVNDNVVCGELKDDTITIMVTEEVTNNDKNKKQKYLGNQQN